MTAIAASPARQDTRTTYTDLELLRLGQPGKPRQKEIARRMKVSKTTISIFESGARATSEEFIRAYARALGASAREVELRYWSTRATYCQRSLHEARAKLKGLRH